MSELAGQQEIDLTLPIPTTTATVDPQQQQQQQPQEHTEQPQAQEQSHDLGDIKSRLQDIEGEASKLKELEQTITPQIDMQEDPEEVDSRSVYVGNVDYGSTPEEVHNLFSSCGPINRVTIATDKYSGQPKGYAYIEFQELEAVAKALLMSDTLFRDRPIKVSAKRTNIPGMSIPRGRGRGMRGYGRGAPRGGYHPYYYGGGGGGFRGGFRGRGRRGGYQPQY